MGVRGWAKSTAHRLLGVDQRLWLARLRHGDVPGFRASARPLRRAGRAEGPGDRLVDVWASRDEDLRVVVDALEAAGVAHVVLPDVPDDPGRPRVGPRTVQVGRSSWDEAVRAVRGLGRGWRVEVGGATLRAVPTSRGGEPWLRAALGVRVTSAADEPAAVASPREPVRDVLEVRERLDVVYTWVDGADEQWQRRRDAARGDSLGSHSSARSASRFTSRDELRYSLRSLEAYAGWTGRVHVVTDGQVPAWLRTAHPRLRLVHHADIFRDPRALPVFNSHAIEAQLHRVDGLSDRYLYLNDDVFLGRPVRPELFFEANGTNRFFLSTGRIPPGPATIDDLPVDAAAKQNRDLLLRRFGRAPSFKLQHVPHPQHRSVAERIEVDFPEETAAVARSRFRSPADLSVASSLQHFYAYELGTAVPGRLDYAYVDLADPDAPLQLYGLLRRRDVDVFCLNEVELAPAAADRADRVVRSFLERYFPHPSSFELEV